MRKLKYKKASRDYCGKANLNADGYEFFEAACSRKSRGWSPRLLNMLNTYVL